MGLHDHGLVFYDFLHILAIKSVGKSENRGASRAGLLSLAQQEIKVKQVNPGPTYPALGRNRLPVYKELSEHRPARGRLEELHSRDKQSHS